MTSNLFISSVLCDFESFLGVIPYDEYHYVKSRKNCIFSVILNTESIQSDIVGHWILLSYASVNGEIINWEIFDSLALNNQIIPTSLIQYIRSLNKYIKYSSNSIQASESTFCGLFCIARFLAISLHVKLDVFLANFNIKQLNKNDKIVTDLILKYIKKIK